ncbi:NAD(P)H-hydrate dehydratase [Candidatus Woesearchaeota archaeon]|nr:NAD(P)H-hydrate dehydratase [Candidatus Woesearchaeota archaeon]
MKTITKKEIRLPRKKTDAKKGDAGRVLIISGSEYYVGAPFLAAMAALRTGCDWVTVAAPEKVAWAINTMSPDIITIKLKGTHITNAHRTTLQDLIKKHDAILIGPGIGTKNTTSYLIKNLLKYGKAPFVLDADAIKLIQGTTLKDTVLTPNQNEFKLLTADPIKNNIIIQKGPIDIIHTPLTLYKNTTGVPRMAIAGTGDVLAGCVASWVAQGLNQEQAAINAVYLVGKAGEEAAKDDSRFIASDILYYL